MARDPGTIRIRVEAVVVPDLDTLVLALERVDRQIAIDFPEDAESLLGDEVKAGRRQYARFLIDQYEAIQKENDHGTETVLPE